MIKEIFELQNPWRSDTEYTFSQKERTVLPILISNIKNNKIIGLIGSRQVGKSSILYLLISYLLNKSNIKKENIFYFNLDDIKIQELFLNIPSLISFLGKSKEKKYLFIDEIQRLSNPGLLLKEIYDLSLNIKIFYSGSSQLEIKSKMKEHLVGRARTFEINRLSFEEYNRFSAPTTKKISLEEMLIFGSYPEVGLEHGRLEKKLLIKDIYNTYIEKDLTDYLKLDNITAFNKLLGYLAFQICNLLNIERIANSLRIKRSEVEKYIEILENTFIIKLIYPFYQNYSKEIIKTPKIFFLDLGLRNYAINNFAELDKRDDTGKLFENFYFLELLNKDIYGFNKINYWRTTNQTEIDFIVSSENKQKAIEVKWNSTRMPRSFTTIKTYYPEIETKLITNKDFIG